MVFIVTLEARQLSSVRSQLRNDLRFTKALTQNSRTTDLDVGPAMVLVVSWNEQAHRSDSSRHLEWLGVVRRHNTVGAIDQSITIDPLREVIGNVPLDGAAGLLGLLTVERRQMLEEAIVLGEVRERGEGVWQAIDQALRRLRPDLTPLLDWLLAQAQPVRFNPLNAADRSWQEQWDAARCAARIADFPSSALAAFRRPEDEDAPLLSGIVAYSDVAAPDGDRERPHEDDDADADAAPHLAQLAPRPVENSLIEHDIRAAPQAFSMASDWLGERGVRCDIHVLTDSEGRRLELINVNATPIESRTGTDLIYYHHPTQSFVLVQYKRLRSSTDSIYVDPRLRGQLDRLEKVAEMSMPPQRPADWRLGSDPCFLKLAYWPAGSEKLAHGELAPGMYLPVSYVRMLLQDECTQGVRSDKEARYLGYKHVPRHIVGGQFVELVKHGLVGTIGTSADQLRAALSKRVEEGHSVLLATELSFENAHERQARNRKRGSKNGAYTHTHGAKGIPPTT